MKTTRVIFALVIVLLLLCAAYSFYRQPQQVPKTSQSISPTITKNVLGTSIQTRTKSSGCVATQGIEDEACTPGDVIKGATREQICVPGYSKSVRNVPESVKKEVYAEYGITTHMKNEYEVDHLISLELGGSNDISNLWPESAEPRPGFHEKDKVENYLHKLVCSGQMTLSDAQIKIAHDWKEFLPLVQN